MCDLIRNKTTHIKNYLKKAQIYNAKMQMGYDTW